MPVIIFQRRKEKKVEVEVEVEKEKVLRIGEYSRDPGRYSKSGVRIPTLMGPGSAKPSVIRTIWPGTVVLRNYVPNAPLSE